MFKMHIRLVWWSCCFCACGGRSCSSVLSHLVLVARTLSRLAKLKLDLSAFYCFVVSHVLLVSVLLLHSLSLSCSEQSAQLKGLQGVRSELRLSPERSQRGSVHPPSKSCASAASGTSVLLISVVFMSKRGKVIWYWKTDSTSVSNLYW